MSETKLPYDRKNDAVRPPTQVIAVSGGKGGIGKTNISVNLAYCLAQLDKRVMLLDADLGLANVDILLGLKPKSNLEHVIDGQCSLDDVIIDTAQKIKIIPASSGTQLMTELTPLQHAGLINAFSDLQTDIDFLIIDVAAGISDSVVSFCRAAYEVVLVVCDEPMSMTDVYATIKVLSKRHELNHFHILANMVDNEESGYNLFRRLHSTCDQFLDVTLEHLGSVPYDENLKKAVQKQSLVCEKYPSSRASSALVRAAKKIQQWTMPTTVSEGNTFFIERLVDYSVSQGG